MDKKERQRKYCKSHYERNKDYYYDRNIRRKDETREWLNLLKAGKSCADCGNAFPLKAMDWHHEGGKDFEVAKAVGLGYGKKRILAEIEKCVLLCAICHRLKEH